MLNVSQSTKGRRQRREQLKGREGGCKETVSTDGGRLGKLFKLIPIQGSHLYTGTIRRASVKISGDGFCLKSTWNRTLLGKGLVVQEAAPMALADSCHSELSGRA